MVDNCENSMLCRYSLWLIIVRTLCYVDIAYMVDNFENSIDVTCYSYVASYGINNPVIRFLLHYPTRDSVRKEYTS